MDRVRNLVNFPLHFDHNARSHLYPRLGIGEGRQKIQNLIVVQNKWNKVVRNYSIIAQVMRTLFLALRPKSGSPNDRACKGCPIGAITDETSDTDAKHREGIQTFRGKHQFDGTSEKLAMWVDFGCSFFLKPMKLIWQPPQITLCPLWSRSFFSRSD